MDTYIDYTAKGIDEDKFVKSMFSYESLWHKGDTSPVSPEYIVTHEHMADVNNYDWTRHTYFIPESFSRHDGYCSYEPVQDLIDAYWDVDGKTVRNDITMERHKERCAEIWKDSKNMGQSQFIEKAPQTDIMKYNCMREFRSRDDRLYVSMIFPFKGWREAVKGALYFCWDSDLINKDGNESWTGYSYRKMVTLDPYDIWTIKEDHPVIRYAEVLLTYAEARIQNSGWDTEIQKALNGLRDRCGMPDVPTSMPSKEKALTFVRNERRIELAAEDHRFDDIRRYGSDYCSKVMNGSSHASNGYAVINEAWDERLILMPISQGAIDLNLLLKNDQNPGY